MVFVRLSWYDSPTTQAGRCRAVTSWQPHRLWPFVVALKNAMFSSNIRMNFPQTSESEKNSFLCGSNSADMGNYKKRIADELLERRHTRMESQFT